MKCLLLTIITLVVFANGKTIERSEEASNGGGLLGSNKKSNPIVRSTSIENLVLNAKTPAEPEERELKYNPEALYNHIVNVKIPHHREKFDRIAQHFPIWENSLKHVEKKLYSSTVKNVALKLASMNASELQLENVNDFVTNTILNKFAYPIHGLDVPDFTDPINYYSTGNATATPVAKRGKPVAMEPLRHTLRHDYKDLDVTASFDNTTESHINNSSSDTRQHSNSTSSDNTAATKNFGRKLLNTRVKNRRHLLTARKTKGEVS
jgi:hypothetical protein